MYTVRYLVGLGLAIAGCSIFYTALIMRFIIEVFPLEEALYWIVYGILYVVITGFGLMFYIPRLRDIW